MLLIFKINYKEITNPEGKNGKFDTSSLTQVKQTQLVCKKYLLKVKAEDGKPHVC
jgi:hypothetical protein